MVELPQVSRRLVTVEAPTQRATKGEGKQILGRAMQQFGAAVSSFADNLQQSTDMAAAAKTEDAWERANVEAMTKYQNDPEGYDQWATGFREQLVSQTPGKAGERIAAGLQRAQTRNWARLTTARADSLARENEATLTSRLKTQEDELATFANNGDIASPEFTEKFNAVRATRAEMAKNPAFVYSEEMLTNDMDRLDSKLKGTAIVGNVARAAGRDLAEAERINESILTDQSLKLTPKQRTEFHRLGKAAIREVETKVKADWRELDKEVNPVLDDIAKGKVDENTAAAYRERAIETGNIRTLNRIDDALNTARSVGLMKSVVPPREWGQVLSGQERVTAYTPMRIPDPMQGGYASSRPGPDGQAEVRTLEDFDEGRSPYVTVAGNPKFYGREYTIPSLTYVNSRGETRTLQNVRAVVHDTGGAFREANEGRFDIPVARDMDLKRVYAQPFLRPNAIEFRRRGGGDSATLPGGKLGANNWNLSFYKPEDILPRDPKTLAVTGEIDAAVATMADRLGKRFFDETGVRVNVNDTSPNPTGTEGRRRGLSLAHDNPHVENSEHLRGAFDFQIQGLSTEQKRRFLEIARDEGFTGVGFYGDSGHLHLDRGRARSWGPVPDWARDIMAKPANARPVDGDVVGAERRPRPAVAAGIEKQLIEESRDRLKANMPAMLDQVRKGRVSSDSPELQDIAAMVGFAGTDKEKADFVQALTEREVVDKGLEGDATARQEILDGWNARLQAGGTAREWEAYDRVAKVFKDTAEDLKKQPYETFDNRPRPDGTRQAPFPPLDPTNAAMFKAGLAQRMRTQAEIREWGDMGPFSALAAKDKPVVEEALRSGGAEVVGPVLRELAALDPEVSRATLAQIKDTVRGLTRTTDPNIYNATFEAIGVFANKAGGLDAIKETFDEGMVRDYQTWEGRYRYMKVDEMREALRKDRDPTMEKIRADLRSDARREATSATSATRIAPEDVVKVFDDRTFADPGAPMDEGGGGVATTLLYNDYLAIYAERRGDGMDHDTAKKQADVRIMQRWGTTEAGGGWRIMQHPPENQTGYKGVLTGAEMRSSVQTAVDEWLTRTHPDLVPRQQAGPRGPISSGARAEFSLMADSRTEAEIAAKIPPSYTVVVRLPNGQFDVVKNAQGAPSRFHWRTDAQQKLQTDRNAAEDQFRRFRERAREQDDIGREIQENPRRPVPIPNIGGTGGTTGGGF
jgi:hypothetical protein